MPAFDSTLLARYFNEGERNYSSAFPFLVDRTSLSIVSGTGTYTLPDYVRSIRRITFLGQKLDPLPRRNQRDTFQAATQQSKPFWYIYNNIGLNKISLFPIPAQTVATVTSLWGATAISTGCVVEFYRITDNSSFVLPDFIKRQLLKQYVAAKAFSAEGHGQNLKLVQYFQQRWGFRSSEFSLLLEELHNKPRKLVVSGADDSNYFPASPVLPISRYGVSVDDGS